MLRGGITSSAMAAAIVEMGVKRKDEAAAEAAEAEAEAAELAKRKEATLKQFMKNL